MTPSAPQPDSPVVSVELPDGDLLLLHQETRQYYTLNSTGALIWQYLERSAAPAEIGQALSERFDVTTEDANAAVCQLLTDLVHHKLISVSDSKKRFRLP